MSRPSLPIHFRSLNEARQAAASALGRSAHTIPRMTAPGCPHWSGFYPAEKWWDLVTRSGRATPDVLEMLQTGHALAGLSAEAIREGLAALGRRGCNRALAWLLKQPRWSKHLTPDAWARAVHGAARSTHALSHLGLSEWLKWVPPGLGGRSVSSGFLLRVRNGALATLLRYSPITASWEEKVFAVIDSGADPRVPMRPLFAEPDPVVPEVLIAGLVPYDGEATLPLQDVFFRWARRFGLGQARVVERLLSAGASLSDRDAEGRNGWERGEASLVEAPPPVRAWWAGLQAAHLEEKVRQPEPTEKPRPRPRM